MEIRLTQPQVELEAWAELGNIMLNSPKVVEIVWKLADLCLQKNYTEFHVCLGCGN